MARTAPTVAASSSSAATAWAAEPCSGPRRVARPAATADIASARTDAATRTASVLVANS
jgi:hypothetical protein